MDETAARKERLKALKAQAQAAEQADGDQPETEKPILKFRNYHVQDAKHIDHQQVAPALPPKLEEPVIEKKPEEAAQEELLVNVAPKKANWDLKRDIQPRLDKLERRTQRAIVEIMQEEERARMQAEGGIQD